MGSQPIPTKLKGEIDMDVLGLIIGKSNTVQAGLTVHPGIVHLDPQRIQTEIQVLCSSPRGLFSISPGDEIAQVILLPNIGGTGKANLDVGMENQEQAFLTLELNQRPTLNLQIEGKVFHGLLDTGADTSIISEHWWPNSWPTKRSMQTLQGLGYESTPTISAKTLKWRDDEGRSGTVTPYVLPLPINLWGRDILQQMQFRLVNDYSIQSQNIMKYQGGIPGKGIGKHLQGITDPIEIENKLDRTGLGFS